MKTYAIKDVFRTIQGEGYHVGTPALFVRFAGCNMWSGYDEDRIRDAVRNEAECPRWCDTDFRPDDARKMTADEIAAVVAERTKGARLVVLTGGEPLLQLDENLLHAIHVAYPAATIAIETNGTVAPRFDAETMPWLWLTLSPKRARAHTRLPWAHELKLVVPAYEVDEWDGYSAAHRFVQPLAHGPDRDYKTESLIAQQLALRGDGTWRLSLQTHKIVGVP